MLYKASVYQQLLKLKDTGGNGITDCMVQFSSVTQSCLTLCNPMDYSTPGFPFHHQLPELAQTHVHQVSDAIQPSHPLSSPFSSCLQSFSASGFFSNESVLCIKWPKYWNFSFSVSPSNEDSGLISFRMDWLDLLAAKGLSRVFSNTTVWHSAFYSPTLTSIQDYWKNHSLD